jgi:hypothetical protein
VINTELFISKMNGLGYEIFTNDKHSYNINIVGWRNVDAEENMFDDIISLFWIHKGFWEERHYPATTLPGTPWLLNPSEPDGTAILAPGQYKGAYVMGLHRGYPALVQVKPVKVYRDNDRDSQIDAYSGTIETGLFGINIHKAGAWSKVVGQNSAGCQVFQKSADFEDFMRICRLSANYWRNSFTYTLLEFEP